ASSGSHGRRTREAEGGERRRDGRRGLREQRREDRARVPGDEHERQRTREQGRRGRPERAERARLPGDERRGDEPAGEVHHEERPERTGGPREEARPDPRRAEHARRAEDELRTRLGGPEEQGGDADAEPEPERAGVRRTPDEHREGDPAEDRQAVVPPPEGLGREQGEQER